MRLQIGNKQKMADEGDLGFLTRFANSVGTSENVLRLMISLFAGYPLAAVYRKFIHGSSPNVQHLFFITSGIALGYFNFGPSVLHSVANILITYTILIIFRASSFSVALAFVINLLYLCIGYYWVSSVIYTVQWTTPHCVLTLRLTGLMFDVYDGKKKAEQLSNEQKETALSKIPSLLEVAGHSFFFGGTLVGPQFPLKRYLDFVHGKFADKMTSGPPASTAHGVRRFLGGVMYIFLYQISAAFIPDSYLLSESYQELPVLVKCLAIMVWGKLVLYRYVGVWLIAEGSCIMTGLTYNGKDENGNNLWNGCANVHVWDFETASTLQDVINSFNVNTNKWMAKYVFKRLKFLGNKYISQFVTLMYLAIWHGLYTGYFVNFSLEFFLMKFEKEFGGILKNLAVIKSLYALPGGSLAVWFFGKCYTQFLLSYALVSFCLLSYSHYMQVYWSVYFVVHVLGILWIPLYPHIKRLLITSEKQATDSTQVTSNDRTKSD